jgi:acetyl-CoA carboxylase carboxyl transferase subunit alpha
MLQYSTYSVISPEGCASILWKSADRAADAAEAMGITSNRIMGLGLIDDILPEPLGGAHRDPDAMAATLKNVLANALGQLDAMDADALIEARYKKLMRYSVLKGE